jgi:hypothetical protein
MPGCAAWLAGEEKLQTIVCGVLYHRNAAEIELLI